MPVEAPAPPKPPRKKRVRPGKTNINVWISAPIAAAMERYIEETEPTPTATSAFELALKRFLTEVGYWPPTVTPPDA